MRVDPVRDAISSYDLGEITLATLCSHTSLQIFHGAREEGFKTLGLAIGTIPKYYDAYPKAKPDDFLVVNSHLDVLKHAAELRDRSVILIPHGSLVEYLGADNFLDLNVPTYGNRRVLQWESDRQKSREWLEGAGVSMPREVRDPRDITSPVIVKYHGAKGGRGFFIASDYADFAKGIEPDAEYTIQEFVLGTRFYFHYFYSPIAQNGYRLSKGALEMLGIDRRLEANVDEIYRAGHVAVEPTFVVTGNIPVVLREKLLRVFRQIKLFVLDAQLQLRRGSRNAAQRSLRKALSLAAPGRFIRCFLDEGQSVIGMLSEEHQSLIDSGGREVPQSADRAFVEVLLRASGAELRRPATSAGVVPLEHLTGHETRILIFLANGVSNREMADRLFVSENTVKFHLKNIYSKLSVSSRVQAIAVARNLGIIR